MILVSLLIPHIYGGAHKAVTEVLLRSNEHHHGHLAARSHLHLNCYPHEIYHACGIIKLVEGIAPWVSFKFKLLTREINHK